MSFSKAAGVVSKLILKGVLASIIIIFLGIALFTVVDRISNSKFYEQQYNLNKAITLAFQNLAVNSVSLSEIYPYPWDIVCLRAQSEVAIEYTFGKDTLPVNDKPQVKPALSFDQMINDSENALVFFHRETGSMTTLKIGTIIKRVTTVKEGYVRGDPSCLSRSNASLVRIGNPENTDYQLQLVLQAH